MAVRLIDRSGSVFRRRLQNPDSPHYREAQYPEENPELRSKNHDMPEYGKSRHQKECCHNVGSVSGYFVLLNQLFGDEFLLFESELMSEVTEYQVNDS